MNKRGGGGGVVGGAERRTRCAEKKKCEETRGGKRQTRTPFQRRLARAAALVLLLLVAAASASEANPPRCFNPKAPYAKFGEPTDKKNKTNRVARRRCVCTSRIATLPTVTRQQREGKKSITPTATERREIPLLLQDPNGWPLLLVMHRPPLQELYGRKRDFPPAPRAANRSRARRASRAVTGRASTPGRLPLAGLGARHRRCRPLKQGCVVTSRVTKR